MPKQDQAQGFMTTDHDLIRSWTEDRDGQPARVRQTGGRARGGRSGGLLRIEFQDRKGSLEPISWEEFFDVFDRNNLVFLYQTETKDGKQSRFFKFVSRETANEQGEDMFENEDDHADAHEHEDESDQPHDRAKGSEDVEEDDDDDKDREEVEMQDDEITASDDT